jgi:adenine-specific DNA-methyltransferase
MKNNFAVTHEYGLFLIPEGCDLITRLPELADDIRRNLRRTGIGSRRVDVPRQFYGIEVDRETLEIVSVGESLALDQSIPKHQNPKTEMIYPIDDEGIERRWYYARATVIEEIPEKTVWAKRIKTA